MSIAASLTRVSTGPLPSRLLVLSSIVGGTLIGCSDAPGPSGPGPPWVQLEAGAGVTCGVTADGRGYCWGEGWALGRGGVPDRAVPTPQEIRSNLRWRVIEVGREIACGLTFANETVCWGRPMGTSHMDTVPTRLRGDPGLVQLSAGDTHACGLTAGGVAYCWGDDARGQTGVGYPASLAGAADSALPVAGNLRFLAIRAGPESTCGVLTNGDLSCWGGSEVEGEAFEPRTVQAGYHFSTLAYGGNIGGRGHVCAGSLPVVTAVGGTWLPFSVPPVRVRFACLPSGLDRRRLVLG